MIQFLSKWGILYDQPSFDENCYGATVYSQLILQKRLSLTVTLTQVCIVKQTYKYHTAQLLMSYKMHCLDYLGSWVNVEVYTAKTFN